MSRRRWCLVPVLAVLGACTSSDAGPIAFHGEADLLASFEWDSGFLPAGSPAQVRIAVRGGGGATMDAQGTASGDVLTPVPGSGAVQSRGELTLAVHAKVDVASIHYEGLVQEIGYAIPARSAAFDPFLLDGTSTSLDSTLPPGELLSAPIPSVPGSTLVLAIEGGTLTTTFAGTCARARGGYAQYLGHATVSGTVDLSATIEIEVPFSGTQTFGPFAIQVSIPPIERDVDLGLFDIASGTRAADGPSPCSDEPVGDGGVGVDGAIGPGEDGGVRPGDDGGVRMCRPAIERPVGQACDYATLECLSEATTSEAFDACIAADGAPELCSRCLTDEVTSCSMCTDAYQALGCCADDNRCSGLDDDRFRSCLDAFCPEPMDAWYACITSPPCGNTDLCFRAPR